MNRKIRWGLLGAGKILDRWMKGARQIEDMEIVAVSDQKQSACRIWHGTSGDLAENRHDP